MSKLKKRILRDAAALLTPGGEEPGAVYMCYAVSDAGGYWPEFAALLIEHRVATTGSLRFLPAGGWDWEWPDYTERDAQSIRFMFLHFLAESL